MRKTTATAGCPSSTTSSHRKVMMSARKDQMVPVTIWTGSAEMHLS